MDLYWISPNDTQATEIASYSRKLMPYLQAHCTVLNANDFRGDIDSPPSSPDNPPQTPVVDVLRNKRDLGMGPIKVYHLGNSRSHCDIYDEFKEKPGVVVLHDVNLIDLAQSWAYARSDYMSWRDFVRRQYGDELVELAALSDDYPEERVRLIANFPLFKPFIHGAQAVVVHSNFAHELVEAAVPKGVEVVTLALPYPSPPPPPQREYGASTIKFIFCGHVGPNRRLEQFMRSWGRLDGPERFSFSLFGNISQPEQLLDCARENGLDGLVKIEGFVDEDALEKALREAHFAINLRWPTMGETSSSQLRYWSHALPTIVTNVGWFAELPDHIVLKIPVEDEEEALYQQLQSIAADPTAYSARGLAGWDYLKEVHSPEKYALEFTNFIKRQDSSLKKCALEGALVSEIAAMCEDHLTLRLFQYPVEVATAALDPTPYN